MRKLTSFLLVLVMVFTMLPHQALASEAAEGTSEESIVDTTAPVEEPTPTQTSAPTGEDPAPVVEDPAPIVEDPAPTVEDPAPIVKDPAPIVEDPAPIVEDPAPIVENLTPIDGPKLRLIHFQAREATFWIEGKFRTCQYK